MKCKCSLNNMYHTIGLCDLTEYNEKIIKFRDKSYSQFNYSEQIVIPNNFPNIERIIKLYVNINIDSTKIVDTPSSKTVNYEGFSLTGKMLLIHGSIEQNIIYSKDKDLKCKYSLKVNTDFNNYIVLDENADKVNDSYLVYPYIEDISLIPFNNRTINESITIFLFANNKNIKPVPPPQPIEKLPNAFIFKTFDTDKEMARVEFDKTNNKLVVSSTSASYNNGKEDQVFLFELRNSSQTEIKGSEAIMGDKNADNFKESLDGVDFEYGDLIFLSFEDNSKVYLTNYPSLNENYNMLANLGQGFIITQLGIMPYTLLNDILLNNSSNKPVVKIGFDILSKEILVNSYGNNSNPGGKSYFKMTLLEDDLKTEKATGIIEGNSNGNDLKRSFFNKSFAYKNVIKLQYEESNMVVITNYPDINNPKYNPKGKEELFVITENGLKPFDENIRNIIKVKSINNEEVLSIKFKERTQRLEISSTNVIADPSSTYDYFILGLKNESKSVDLETILSSTEEPEDFEIIANGTPFNFESDRVILSYQNKSSIEISNYPNKGDTYIPTLNASIFKITKDGLVDESFDNKIYIFNDKNEEMATIQFAQTETDPIMIVTSTKAISTTSSINTQKYIEFIKYSKDNLQLNASILGEKDATIIKDTFNDKVIKVDSDILRIANRFPCKIVIKDFNGEANYQLGVEPLFLNVTKTDLVEHNLNYNKIRFKNQDDSTILFVFFDKLTSNTIYVEPYSTEKLNLDSDYFEFKISDKTETTTKFLIRAPKNDRAIFVDVGDVIYNISRNIQIGDILEINCSEPNLVEVIDTRNSEISPLPSVSQRYLIEEGGLKPLNPKPIEKLSNTFVFINIDDEEMARVEFDKLNKKLIVTSTGVNYEEGTSISVFKFELLDDKSTLKAMGRVRGTGDANEFRDELNGKSFDYNWLILLSYDDLTRVSLTNYPSQGDTYNMQGENLEAFLITPNGIAPYVLPNNIVLNNINNNPVFKMRFSIVDRRFFIEDTENVTNPSGGAEYFKATLYLPDATTKKITATIPGNSKATKFGEVFRNRIFQYGDVLTLEYEENNKVLITNFPNSSTPIYNPKANKESFSITKTGLEAYPPVIPPTKELLPNVITFKSITNEVMATISFDKTNKKLIITSTGINYGGNDNQTAFRLLIGENIGFVIRDDGNADSFRDYFNNKDFNFKDKLVISYLIGNKVEITNFPTTGSPIYNPTGSQQTFLITENGLISFK